MGWSSSRCHVCRWKWHKQRILSGMFPGFMFRNCLNIKLSSNYQWPYQYSSSSQGDSGGPLVCNGIAVGVVSFNRNYNCRYPDLPNVYTDISKYTYWINTILKKKDCWKKTCYTLLHHTFLVLCGRWSCASSVALSAFALKQKWRIKQ